MSRFVDQLIELDRETRLAAEAYRVRRTEKVLAAQRQAKVAGVMKGLGMCRREAEQFLEVEDIYSGAAHRRRQGEQL